MDYMNNEYNTTPGQDDDSSGREAPGIKIPSFDELPLGELDNKSWDYLINDVQNYIMIYLINNDGWAACMLSITCHNERTRYKHLSKQESRELCSFDYVMCSYSQFRDDLYWGGTFWILPGERGKEFAIKLEKKIWIKIFRNEYRKPMIKNRKKFQRKEKMRLKYKKYDPDIW
jgi:hypothetical protein